MPPLALGAVGLAFHAAFLGGAAKPFAVLLIGLALAFHPPTRLLGRWMNTALVFLLLWSLVPLAPLEWLGLAEPAWRANLRDYAPDLPRTISPQPALTGETCFLFAAAVAAFYWFGTLRYEEGRVGMVVRLAAGAAALFAGVCIVFHAVGYQPPLWHNNWGFGPFPSRNHTGNLLALGAVLCGICAVADFSRKRARAWWLLAGLVICAVALVQNLSRGGMLAAIIGLGAFGVWLAWRRRSGPVFATAVAGLVVVAVGLFFFAGRFSERVAGVAFGAPREMLGFRADVYADAARMIAAGPPMGIGLGNFEAVFPFFREDSVAPVRLIHPESDWFWASAELGWVGLALLFAAMAAAMPAIRAAYRSAGRRPNAVHAALFAMMAFTTHTLIDVPAHMFGTALPALLLAGALVGGAETAPAPVWLRRGFRGLGVALCLAVVMVHSTVGPPSRQAAQSLARAREENRRGAQGNESALKIASSGLKVAPLSWELRFQRGIALMRVGSLEEAQAELKTARLLQPGRADLPEIEAAHWLRASPALAAAAWRESLALDPAGSEARFKRLLDAGTGAAALRDLGGELAFSRPAWFLLYLARCDNATAAAAIESWRAKDPALAAFSTAELRFLLHRWWPHDPARIADSIRADERWLAAGWPLLALDLAEKKQLEEACELARQHLKPPELPVGAAETPQALRLRLLRQPSDFAAALALSRSHEMAGDLATARFVITKALEQKDAPGWLAWRQAELASRAGEHEVAWLALRRYGAF